jgi:CRP/FNR family transcriptional regulator
MPCFIRRTAIVMTGGLNCAECPVSKQGACAALSVDERDELARLGRHRLLQPGETLFAAGDDSLACATLISGSLKIACYDRDGDERILSLVHPAGFVGELFAPMARHDVVALTESRLCVFSRSDYEVAINRFPALAAALLKRSADDLAETRSLIDLMGRRSARARVAGLIMAFARAASQSSCHAALFFELPVSRGEMAGLLGLTIETISRQFGELEKEGLIGRVGRRGLVVKTPAALEALV